MNPNATPSLLAPDAAEPGDLISLAEAARLSLTRPLGRRHYPFTLRQLIKDRRLRGWRRGEGLTRVSRAEVLALYEEEARTLALASEWVKTAGQEGTPDDLLPMKEAAKLIRSPRSGKPLSTAALFRMIQDGKIPGYRQGRSYYVSRRDIDVYLGLARVPVDLHPLALAHARAVEQAALQRQQEGETADPATPFPPDLLSMSAAAALLPGDRRGHRSPNTLKRWIGAGRLPAWTDADGHLYVSRQDLFDYCGPVRVEVKLHPAALARAAQREQEREAKERAKQTDEILRRVGVRK